MSDEPAQTPADPDPAQGRARIEPSPAPKKRDLLSILYLVGFVALAGTLMYLWQNPPESHLAPQEAQRVDTLQSQIATLRDDVGKLQQQKPPPPPPGPSQAAFDKLQQQANALENKPAATPEQLQLLAQQVQSIPKQTPDLQPLTQRVDALEQRPQVDQAGLETKISQVDTQLQQVGSQVPQLASRMEEANGKLGQLLQQTQARLDDFDKQQRQTADQIKAVAQKAALAARLQGVAAALAAGQKLGDIAGAPPAIARFANEAPPTEASLRGTFDSYAAAAAKASQPAIMDNQDFGSRLWTRAQQAVTVRQGDRVLLGDPVTGVIAQAREHLDSGDLSGAVDALKGLAGPAAAAIQPWVDKARSLLDARSAIAGMAAG